MRRVGNLLAVVAVVGLVALVPFVLAPSAMAAGGQSPGLPGKITGPAVSGTLVVDPHEDALTPEAKRGTLRLQKGGRVAGVVFFTDLPYTCGCDVALTNLRFRNVKLDVLIPPADLLSMFKALGMLPATAVDLTGLPGQPIITDINNSGCTGSRDASGALVTIPNDLSNDVGTCQVAQGSTLGFGSDPIAGTLSFDVVVQFFIQTPP